ncbi:MAG: radical SAM protein [bacterium]
MAGRTGVIVGRPLVVAITAVSSPQHYTLWNALAAESLAGDLRGYYGEKVQVRIFRIRSESERRSTVLSLRKMSPDVLGVSVECGGLDLALSLVDELMGNVWGEGCAVEPPKLYFGGKIPTYLSESFVTRYPSAIVVRGEGELPLRRLTQRFFDSSPELLCDIPNLAFAGDSGQLVRTRSEQPVCSGLIYPPSTDTVPELLEAGAGTLMTQASRGCSWSKCSYCTVSSFRAEKKWEPLPWDRTRKHLESLVALGVREFEFCDDEFIGGRDQQHLDRVRSIALDLRRLGREFNNGIVFRVFLIPHTVFRADDPTGNEAVTGVLRELKAAGLARVYFGVESGSDAQLKRYCRGTPRSDVIGALNVVKDLNVGIDCGFIMFDPSANIEDIAQNVQFFRRQGLIAHNQWPFRPLIANFGAGFGQTMARRGVSPDPDYMCYRYTFGDARVQKIFDIVDALSSKTRSLFYSLKVISKVHFDPMSETCASKRARELVIENGLIYLDMIDSLIASSYRPDDNETVTNAVAHAEECIQALVRQVSHAVERGDFGLYSKRLEMQLVAASTGYCGEGKIKEPDAEPSLVI